MKEEINMKDKIVKLSNGVKVINTSPHPFTFEDGTVVPPCGRTLNAEFKEGIFGLDAMSIKQLGVKLLSSTLTPKDEDASFVATAEVVYLGKPNEAWSIVGLLNGRKTQTEVRLNIKIKEVKTDEVVSKRGIGSTQTNIQATGLQINEEMEFGKSELGGALRKAIEDAILKH